MKKENIISTIILLLAAFWGSHPAILAQSNAVKKAADAVFTLTTFKADGTVIATTNGVFIGSHATGVSPWTPFVGADHAVVIDSKGAKHDVESMIGANGIYDIARFHISGNAPATLQPVSQRPAANGQIWVVPNKKSNAPQAGSIANTETFMDKYAYYILNSEASDMMNGCPVVENSGKVLGIYNVSSTTRSSTDLQFAMDFAVSGMSQNDPTLQQTAIRIALPTDQEQARLALMLAAEHGTRNYEATVDDFIRLFPNLNDGYYAKALIAANKNATEEAEKVLQTALQKVDDKAEAHHNYARFLLSLANSTESNTDEKRNAYLEKALAESKQAQSLSAEPVYQQMEAQLHYNKGDYQLAYDQFMALADKQKTNGELYYQAALAQEQLGGEDSKIHELLDKAVEVCDTPYTIVAAPYLLARGIQRDKMKDYRNAMTDFYIYEAIMYGQVGAPFYFMRGQSEARGKIFQPALNDIAHAIALDPRNTLYWAELASLNLRVKKLPEAIKSAEQCIALDPTISEAYLVLGVAQAESGQKSEGIRNMEKAKELGNEQAETFLAKYK